jgi:RNA polymerase primary sigma factor
LPQDIAAQLGWSTHEVRDLLAIGQQPVSLEKPVGDDAEQTLGDFVEDEAAESAFDIAWGEQRTHEVRRLLDSLPEREREVIEMRFGLTGARPFTLEEIGRLFDVTRERIRQIEHHALGKLRGLPQAQALRNAA